MKILLFNKVLGDMRKKMNSLGIFFPTFILGLMFFTVSVSTLTAKDIEKPYSDVDRQYSREVLDIAYQLKDLTDSSELKNDIEQAKAELEMAEKLVGVRDTLDARRPSYPGKIELLTLDLQSKNELTGNNRPYTISVSAEDAPGGWIVIEAVDGFRVSTKYIDSLKTLLDNNIVALYKSSREKSRKVITSVGENLTTPLSSDLSELLLQRKAGLMELFKEEGYELSDINQIDVMIITHQIDALTADLINNSYEKAFRVFINKELGTTATLEDKIILLDRRSDNIVKGLKDLYSASSGSDAEVSVLPTLAKAKKREGDEAKQRGDSFVNDSKHSEAKLEYQRARSAYEEAEKEYNKYFTRVLESIDEYLFSRFKQIYTGYIDSKNSVKGGTTTSIETAMNDVMTALFSADFRGDVEAYLENAGAINKQMAELYRNMGIAVAEKRDIDDLQRDLDLLMSRRKQAEEEENWKEVNSLYTLIQEKIKEIEQMKIERTLVDIEKITKNYEFLYATVSDLINNNTEAYNLDSYRNQCDDLYEDYKSLKRDGDEYYHYFRLKQQYRAAYSRMKSFYGTVSEYIAGRINVDRRRLSVNKDDLQAKADSPKSNDPIVSVPTKKEDEWDPNWDGSEDFDLETGNFKDDNIAPSDEEEEPVKENESESKSDTSGEKYGQKGKDRGRNNSTIIADGENSDSSIVEINSRNSKNGSVIPGVGKQSAEMNGFKIEFESSQPFVAGKGSFVIIQYGEDGLYRLFVNRYYTGVSSARRDAKKIGRYLGLTGLAAPFVINATDLKKPGVNKGYLIQIFSAKKKENIEAFSKKLQASIN